MSLILLVALVVVIVLYRREFCSTALEALRAGKVFEEPLPGKAENSAKPKS